ncbi:MAG: GNAT family N-acetyltransferase [Ferruginibacter sp.]|nr:GNAT family N-acetyltransferase [Ferruginibacter sp.]
MQITIRRATLTDAATLSAISKQTFYDTFTGTCTEEDMQSFLEDNFNLKQVQAELINENDFYYLAETGGRVVGYFRFMEDYTNLPVMKQWKALELKRIYVIKEFQGKGIAGELMDYILHYAKENNFEVVWLGVWEHNLRAQKFYEKYSFVNSGHAHNFPIGNTPQTDWWFWKFL